MGQIQPVLEKTPKVTVPFTDTRTHKEIQYVRYPRGKTRDRLLVT